MDPISLDLGSIEGYGCVLTEIIKYVSESTSLLLESPLEVVAESLEPLLSNIQLKFEVPVDSFVSHLAAVIGKPIVVLLSTTNKAYFNHYQKVRTMASEETCAPCFHTGNQCPREYTRCCKFHHESVLPDKIVMTAVKEILRLYSGRNEHK
jgi:ADP-heptose:LPS heptosyltransferase